ncbi:hypothetical protein [Marinobacter sp.]|uniref:hypothetical protein n=1 Tax=Marinobacter sp. TaxID=50741 RepID=UPI0035C6F152
MATKFASKACCVLLGLLAAWPALAMEPGDLRDALQRKSDRYLVLDAEVLLDLEAQFRTLLSRDDDRDLDSVRHQLEQVGFGWHQLDDGVLLLTDANERGLGHYLFRLTSDSPLMVQAPHQFFDRHSGELALNLFLAGRGSVLALNSAHRRTPIRHRSGKADLAHLEGTVFDALTRAFSQTRPDAAVVQLHGFAAGKRKSPEGRRADLIVSSGQRWLQPQAAEFAACFAESGRWQVLRYPVDVGELGGTTNVQGALLRRLGNNRFVHLELSRPLRDRLRVDRAEFDRFSGCVQALAGGRP